ncbi:MAG: uncharacterized protein A8A55_2834 [Amphiamblys sp. WSBS2006]|nr:MAG: uncharacterized protein A8A55_2834 [Amphiamblys sp. WSBS2006]
MNENTNKGTIEYWEHRLNVEIERNLEAIRRIGDGDMKRKMENISGMMNGNVESLINNWKYDVETISWKSIAGEDFGGTILAEVVCFGMLFAAVLSVCMVSAIRR